MSTAGVGWYSWCWLVQLVLVGTAYSIMIGSLGTRNASVLSLLARFLLHVAWLANVVWFLRQVHLVPHVARQMIGLEGCDSLITGRDDVDNSWSRCGPCGMARSMTLSHEVER